MDSKEYSWKWIEASELLSHGPCELVYALVTSAGAAGFATFYDGENTLGETILILESPATVSQQMQPPVPIYCRRGLYVTLEENAKGVLVQWRELGHKAG